MFENVNQPNQPQPNQPPTPAPANKDWGPWKPKGDPKKSAGPIPPPPMDPSVREANAPTQPPNPTVNMPTNVNIPGGPGGAMPDLPQPNKRKYVLIGIIIFAILVLLIAGAIFALNYFSNTNENTNTAVTNNANVNTTINTNITADTSSCNKVCKDYGYTKGICERGGSSVESTAKQQANLEKNIDTIAGKNIDIDDCDFSSIGAWDVCYCLESETDKLVEPDTNTNTATNDNSNANQNTNTNVNTNTIVNSSTLDTDEDGLTDVNEDIYGTDWLNPDTDGDSYSDGDEITSGYNPLCNPETAVEEGCNIKLL